MIIDAHQHFWDISRGDYGWLTPALGKIYRNFEPQDLKPLLRDTGVDATILVQAAPTVSETEYLLKIAEQEPFILGVVGWADFEAADASHTIAKLARAPKLVGLRPMIQDIADPDWMLKPQLDPAFNALIKADLTFDALVLPQHLENLHHLLQRYPKLRVVIDHGAKPPISEQQFDDWARMISQIAQETNAYCKLSGLATEANEDWQPTDLDRYIRHMINCFGVERLIWGSDWPVATLAVEYSAWFELAQSYYPDTQQRSAVFGDNASRAYKIKT